jgi:hypothetical protein
MTADALAAALLAAVAAEDAAVFGYSVAGPRLASAAQRNTARGYYDVHRAQRQAVAGWATSRGLTPSPPAPEYALPGPVDDATAAAALLAGLEEATAARYADLVALSSGSQRRAAALALQQAAAREARWRQASVPFPGLVGRLPTPSP